MASGDAGRSDAELLDGQYRAGKAALRPDLTDVGDVDDVLVGWLRTAYDQVG